MAIKKEIPKEYSKRINEVINFIIKNLTGDLSLKKLAAIANYSPFHFQKLFKQVAGESPKQYIIRVKLETAAHLLIIHRHKSITEVAIETGFTSSAIFARAFRNYFGVSAEELRNIPAKERLNLFKKGNKQKQLLETDSNFKNINIGKKKAEDLKIVIKRISLIRGIFVDASLQDVSDIETAFKKIIRLADTNDLLNSSSNFMGMIYPHQGLYKAMVSIDNYQQVSGRLLTTEIKAGKYAAYKIKGDLKYTFETLKIFTELWLPENGYRLADIFGFELLSEKPLNKSYHKLEREIYIPIEPE